MAVTIKTVAEAAGVSTATVSHVFNETRYVAEETRQKVLDAAERLGYVPSINASSLRSNRSKRIGLLVPAISSFFTVDILDSIEQVLLKNGYQLIIGCTHENLEREKEQMAVFNYQQVDGVLMFPAPGDHSYLDKMTRKYPIVFIDRAAANCTRDLIIGDNEHAAHDIVCKMIEEGHERIGVITGTENVSALEERVCGYRRALEEHGIAFDPALVRNGESTASGGFEATKALLEEAKLSAILALTPAMSVGCLKYLTRNHVRIPDEVALASFGDSQWAEVTAPPLTVLCHPMLEMGHKAAEILLQRLEEFYGRENEEPIMPYETIRMPIELVRRKSF